MRIAVFGLGYVGAVSCGCLAKLGHEVVGIDVSPEKVDLIKAGKPPVIEDQLDGLVEQAVAEGRLQAMLDVQEALAGAEMAFVCVGTPSTRTGGVDDRYLLNVCQQLREHGEDGLLVVVRSTCLPHVHAELQKVLGVEGEDSRLHYVCHPEFLREGVAVDDFFEPPKIVFGASSRKAEAVCAKLYPGIGAPTFFASVPAAAMIKYADNCFHATKVTFGNEVGNLCNEFGVDAKEVMEVFCADTKLNISPRYLRPGAPFGGSCLPKDLRAVLDLARDRAIAIPMLSGALDSNQKQVESILARVRSAGQGKKVGMIGLAFKEGTDDLREAPQVTIAEQLLGKGFTLEIYDPHLSVSNLVGANRSFALDSIPHLTELLKSDMQQVVTDAAVVVVCHRLTDQDWAAITIPESCRVLDLAGVERLASHSGYDGLYW